MATPPESIELYCRAANEYKASDLILHEGEPPIVRISGSMTPMEAPALAPGDLRAFRAYCGVPESAVDFDTSFVSEEGILRPEALQRITDRICSLLDGQK